jgi:hypothetical protein
MSAYNNWVINSANKMKTIWNIIKTKTIRSKGHASNKYQNSPEAFNKYFLSTAVKIEEWCLLGCYAMWLL